MADLFRRAEEARSTPPSVPSREWDEACWEDFLRGHELCLERFLQDVQAFLARQLEPHAAPCPAHDREQALIDFLRQRGWQEPETFVAWITSEEASGDLPDALVEEATSLAYRLSDWGEGLPEALHDSALVTLLVATYDGASMLKRAARFGADQEMIGGALACTKRALGHANTALAAFTEVRAGLSAPAHACAQVIAEELHELRNAIALRILTLRERKALGVD